MNIAVSAEQRESERLDALFAMNILDSGQDDYLDAITRSVASELDVPICLISLVDDHRQWFKSRCGLDSTQTDRNISFCQHAIEQKEVFIVNDAAEHPQFQDNPLVTGEPHIRFYAGAPIFSKDGYCIGTLCAIDKTPRELTEKLHLFLQAMARSVELYLQNNPVDVGGQLSQQLLKLLTATHDDLVFVKDDQFRIVFANAAMMQLYPGKQLEDVLGYTTVEDYLPEDAEEFLKQDKKALEEGESEVFEEILFPDGVNRILWTKKRRCTTSDGRDFIIGIARDVTRQEQDRQQLKQSNEDLENFAYIASHDLKAPLNSVEKICAWIQEDLESKLEPGTQEYFTLLNGRINRMRRLLDDLLQYSRVGRMNFAVEKINLRNLVNDLVAFLDVGEDFKVSADSEEIQIHAVPFELVLRNLIQNAAKHHPAGTGRIQVSLSKNSRDYIICVDDDGEGIPKEFRERAVKIFQTLKPRDEVEGSGMGLAIVNKAIKVLGGKMTIGESPIGGARIQVCWPIYTQKGALQ